MKRPVCLRLACALGLSLASPASPGAEGIACAGSDVTVVGAKSGLRDICDGASEAIAQLASCNLTLQGPVTVEIVESLPGCLGLYHCDDDLIQLLSPDAYARHLSRSPGGPFGHLEPEVFFGGVLRHELAHAALASMPCPFEGCPATKEFVAYTMQIWFLPEAARAPFDRRASDRVRPAFREGVSVVVLMMAPEAFIANAYAYLTGQDDPCGLIADVASGEVTFDGPVR